MSALISTGKTPAGREAMSLSSAGSVIFPFPSCVIIRRLDWVETGFTGDISQLPMTQTGGKNQSAQKSVIVESDRRD